MAFFDHEGVGVFPWEGSTESVVEEETLVSGKGQNFFGKSPAKIRDSIAREKHQTEKRQIPCVEVTLGRRNLVCKDTASEVSTKF